MRRSTLIKWVLRGTLVVLWTIVVPSWGAQPGGSANAPLVWSMTLGTDKPFQPITVHVVQPKDKLAYQAYGRTSEFFFEMQCTAAEASSSIDSARFRDKLLIVGSADLLLREGPRLISDREIWLVLLALAPDAYFARMPRPSGFCQLYLERRSW